MIGTIDEGVYLGRQIDEVARVWCDEICWGGFAGNGIGSLAIPEDVYPLVVDAVNRAIRRRGFGGVNCREGYDD